MIDEDLGLGKGAKRNRRERDPRITRSHFSWKEYVGLFLAIGVITTGEALILGRYLGFEDIPGEALFAASVYSALMALIVCVFTAWGRRVVYERPMRQLAEAARAIARGDFSTRLPIRDRGGKKDYVEVMFEDFNTMAEELGSIETLKDDFVANVSHEIKTPLATIQNYADELNRPGLTPELQREYAASLSDASKRLTTLASNILKLNRLENQTIVAESATYNLAEQLRACILDYEKSWEDKNITIHVAVDDTILVSYDEALLGLVWSNLISNAIKFTDPGGTIEIEQHADSAGIRVTISDTGCGMDEAMQRRIFDKFYQGDTSRAQEGNGLGLALASRAVAMAGGEILVNSTLGRGTVFSVWLPLSAGQTCKTE
ncbi:MAG: HAMP domain-containing sensor histidine kinase [Raoultibacter sp.]